MTEDNFKIEHVASLSLFTTKPHHRYIVTSDEGYHGCFWAEILDGKMMLVLGELSDALEETYWEQKEAEAEEYHVKNPS